VQLEDTNTQLTQEGLKMKQVRTIPSSSSLSLVARN
jgi:hypothetical protein